MGAMEGGKFMFLKLHENHEISLCVKIKLILKRKDFYLSFRLQVVSFFFFLILVTCSCSKET